MGTHSRTPNLVLKRVFFLVLLALNPFFVYKSVHEGDMLGMLPSALFSVFFILKITEPG